MCRLVLMPMMKIRVVRVVVQHLAMVVLMTMSVMVAGKIVMVMLVMHMVVIVLEGIVPIKMGGISASMHQVVSC